VGAVVSGDAQVSAVDDVVAAELVEQFGFVGVADDADGDGAGALGELDGVGAQAAGGAPDQYDVAHFDAGAVGADEHAVGGAKAQGVAGGFLPGQVGGFAY